MVSDDEPASKDAAEHAQVAHETPRPSPEPTLLFITDYKDGDSFVASDGNEYRLGLVNAPEQGEACGEEAAAFTHDFLADGFTTDTYATDTHGRKVAEIFDKNEQSLNVALAKSGLGDDTFLAEFRHENEDLAQRLDAAFAVAPTPACLKPSPTPAPAPVPLKPAPAPKTTQQSSCMQGYSPCLPIVGDLDCGEIGHPVRVTGSDPYRLDRDRDGIGCD